MDRLLTAEEIAKIKVKLERDGREAYWLTFGEAVAVAQDAKTLKAVGNWLSRRYRGYSVYAIDGEEVLLLLQQGKMPGEVKGETGD